MELAPNAAEAYVALGSVHLAKKELTEAVRLFSEALKYDPSSVAALVNLGSRNSRRNLPRLGH